MGLLKLSDPNEVQAYEAGEETVRVPLDVLRKQMALLHRLKNRLCLLELVEDDEDFISAPVGPTFQARVQYVQPTFAELGLRFDFVHSAFFDGASIEMIDRCKNVSRAEGKCTFGYVALDQDATVDECLIKLDRMELRPALYEELLAFSQQFPGELRKCDGIVALGSVVVEGEFHGIPFYNRRLYNRELDTVWIGSDLPKGFKLLGVLEDR